MKNVLLITGIAGIAAGVLSLLYAGLNFLGYHNLLDGSAGLYDRLHGRMILFLIIGIVLAAIGTVCLIARGKIS